ncbi:MAG: hypothetical protein A2941_03005 [Candidatus Yanofskybacteria bacterium RIFCSPLOWO2_01_FULL_49_17]|uniref:Uncharacterized protein n=1 Tax=Candidatus Yanofskybacteria bacterium RIFCSPLOWO2_01_FULL_49_17 TaxID=1802700 RepID=A0A1F8GRC1_9BACT|nr:MAG: hypothetical protein A2941_03005 [Candidatus Yanofskybacteria bacterium RIFCSPLOWO2_01_FULL_49_17]
MFLCFGFFRIQRRQNFLGVLARQRNFLKEVFDLNDKLIFTEILFLARASLLGTAVVSVYTSVAFRILRSYRATARGAFHKAKKRKVVFSVWANLATLSHNLLAQIKKFL